MLHALLGLLAGQQGLDLVVRDPEAGPELRVQGASPHHVACLVGELLAYPELGCVHVLVELLEGQDPEGHVAGLIGHDVAEHRLEEWLLGCSEHQAEGGQGQPLDDHLHAEVDEVPAFIAEHLVYERLEVLVDRVGGRHLLVEVPGEGLHVACLVDHLGGGVVLGVDPRDSLHEACRAQQGALLSMEELAERCRLGLYGELDPLVVVPGGHR